MKEEEQLLENHPLFKEGIGGISIDVSFSYEIQRWDIQLRAEAIVKTSQGTEKITRGSSCIELDKTYLLFPDDPVKAFGNEVELEFAIMWANLTRTIQKHLERQGLLMSNDAMHDHMQDTLARTRKRNKKRAEEREKKQEINEEEE